MKGMHMTTRELNKNATKGKFGFIMNNNNIIFGSNREWYQGIFPQCTSGIVHGPCSSL